MDRRTFVKGTVAATSALAMPNLALAATGPIRVGVIGAKTGPLAAGAAVTHFPPIRHWAKVVNDAGGLKMKGGQRKVELVEYDDRTQPGEAIKAVERLATIDKVDFIMGLYGTSFNTAAAPVFAKHKYPHVIQACVTDTQDVLIKKYPTIFFYNGSSTQYAGTVAGALVKLKQAGQIGKTLAVAHIADTFGIEMKNIGSKILKDAGFDIAYETSYPFTAQDLSPVIKGAKAVNPDAFLAWSYPPDTFGLADAAKIENFNVKVYMSAVGTAFTSFRQKYGAGAENVLGLGGVSDTPPVRKFFADLKADQNVDPDYWGQPVYYSMCQTIGQAMEGAGTADRAEVTRWLKNNTTKTILGEVDIRKQKLTWLWILGQWQGDFFPGVDGVNVSGGASVKLKSGWA